MMSKEGPMAARRARRLEVLFPGGVPRLWCPPLTHYKEDGAIDSTRMRAHLRHLAPHVKGLLAPGSTGDGWAMSPQESRQVMEIALDEAQRLDMRVLVGVLKRDAQEVLQGLQDTVEWLKSHAGGGQECPRSDRNGQGDVTSSLVKAHVCGFTVCPPCGQDLSQEEIGRQLTSLLETDLPLALYQLPQVTRNEISPELASALAGRFENFLLFKDSSGADRIVLSGKGLEGVFTMRGGEGNYARWLRLGGGPYDGFLLGSANCFAAQLHEMIEDLSAGRTEAAQRMSARLTAVVGEVGRAVATLPAGSAFPIANKAVDHFFAHGPRAEKAAAPRIHGGGSAPAEVIRVAGEALTHNGLMPAKGYLE